MFARDANIPLPLTGDVVAVPPTTNAPGCDPNTHIAVWNLALSVAGNAINIPVHVDQTSGAETALGAYKLVAVITHDRSVSDRAQRVVRIVDGQLEEL